MMKFPFLLILVTVPLCLVSQEVDSIYFENYSQVIDLSAADMTHNFTLLDSAVLENDFFFTAEQHWKAINSKLQFSFLQYLHQKAGVRYLLLEAGYSYGFLVNRFLESGDEKLLKKALEDIPVCPLDKQNLFQKIRAYNLTLPVEDRIKVFGIDLEHSPILSLQTLHHLIPTSKIPDAIAPYIQELIELHYSPYYDKSEVKGFFKRLNKDLIRNEDAYKSFWKADFETCRMIVENTLMGYKFTLLSAILSKKGWESREQRMYKNFLLLASQMKSGKFYAQFGALHTDIGASPLWKFPTLANRLNYSENSPVKGKVLTISRYIRKLNANYNRPVEYGMLKKMTTLAENKFSDSIVLLSMIGNETPFEELSKTFQYIILVDQDLEKENCD